MEKIYCNRHKKKKRKKLKEKALFRKKGRSYSTISIGNVCGAPEDGNYKYAHGH